MKYCPVCDMSLEYKMFYPEKRTKDGYRYCCKKCILEMNKKYTQSSSGKLYHHNYYLENKKSAQKKNRESYIKNREARLMYAAEYRKTVVYDSEKSRAYTKKYRESHPRDEHVKSMEKKYRKNNRLKIQEYVNRRYSVDINFRLASVLRSRLLDAIKGNYKSGSAVRDLGCTIPELKFYLEGKFQDGMSWDNWSLKGWHIDHIIPLSFFDLTDRRQLLQAVHYTNLQPMWAVDNIKKSAKLPAIIKTV